MPFNGSGSFSPYTPGNPVITGTVISSTAFNATMTDIAAGLTNAITRDGQSPPSANLPMASNKLTGLGAGTVSGDSLRFQQLFSQGAPASLPSAATVDIGGQNSVAVEISGTTGITSFGTNYNGPRYIRFSGVLILTNSATLALPGAANITTAAGDTCIAYPNLAGNGWNVVQYQRAANLHAAAGANSDITSLGNNTSTIYTTGGTSTAYTITPNPVYTAYAAGMSFVVNFNAACGVSPTLAINGIATPPNLVKENLDGTYSNLAAGDIPINHRSRVTLISATQALVERFIAPFSGSYTSPAQTITLAGALSLTHSLGGMPSLLQARLRCVTAEGGYSINDEVMFNLQGDFDGAAARGVSVVPTATTLDVRYSSNGFQIVRKDNGALLSITAGNWNLILRAWR
jgi:hypothetical protein